MPQRRMPPPDPTSGSLDSDDQVHRLFEASPQPMRVYHPYEEAGGRRREAEVVAEVVRTIGSSLDLDIVLQRVAQGAKELCRSDLAEVALWNPDATVLEFRGWMDARSPGYRTVQVEPGKGVGGQVIVTGRPFKTDHYAEDPRITKDYLAGVKEEGVIAQLAVPIFTDDRVDGVLYVSNRAPRRFTGEDEAILVRLAAYAAMAIKNARLYSEAQRRQREAEELARVARVLTETLNVSTVGERIVESVLPLFGAHGSAVRLLQPDGSLVGIAWAGKAREHFKPGHTVSAGMGVSGRAVLEGRPIWTPDVLNDPTIALTDELRSRNVSGGFHGSLAVPLHVRGEVIGALYIADRRVRTFSEAEVALLQAFADQAALALQNARLHEETSRQRREAEIVADLTRSINASLDLDTVLQRVAEGARELCGSDLGRIALRTPDRDAMGFRHWAGGRFEQWDALSIQPGMGVGGQVLLTGRPFRTDRYAEDPRITKDFLAVVQAEGIVAVMAVPITIGGRVEGLLFVDNCTPRPFTDHDGAILLRLAEHAAIAIQNARLHGAAQQRLRDTETLLAVGRSIGSPLDPTETMRRVAREMARALGADMVGAYVSDQDGRVLQPLAGYHVPAQLVDVFREFPLPLRGHRFLEEGWQQERLLFVGDPAADPRIDPGILDCFSPGSVLFVPLVVRGEPLGGLFGVWWKPREVPTFQELRLAEGIGRQAALILEDARLFAASERRRREAESLAKVSGLLSRSLETEEVARRIVDSVRTLFGAGESVLYRQEPESGDLVALAISTSLGPTLTPHRHLPQGSGLAGLAAREGRPMATPDVLTDPRVTLPERVRAWIEEGSVRAVLAVPLAIKETVIGALAIRDREGRVFNDEEIRLAQVFADQGAVALENARLFEEVRAGGDRLHALSAQLVELQETERRHLARELHDEIGQALIALKLTLHMSARSTPGEAGSSLREAQGVVEELMTRVRELSLDLRPAMLDDLGLLPTLVWHIERYAARTGVHVTFKHSGLERRFPPDVETAAYRIVQEALSNVARHAGVRQATVRLWGGSGTETEALNLEVEDEGIGFDADTVISARATGGVAGMQERALLLGGRLTVESASGVGTRVRAELAPGTASPEARGKKTESP